MNKLKLLDQEGLAARVNALRVAAQALRSHKPDALDAIRRISRSLKLSEEAYRYPQVGSLVRTLEDAQDGELVHTLSRVLPRLRALTVNIEARHHTILILEDDELTRHILEQRLSSPHRLVLTASSIASAEKILARTEISFILMDLEVEDGDGRELLLRLRERPATASVPIFVLSSKDGSQVQTECFALGADAYFHKPFDITTLSTAVAAKLQRTAEVARRSTTDPLTGLPNRAVFTNAFTRAAMLASRSGAHLSVAMLDVDRFKSVNDLYGHQTGDVVLKRLATVVSASLRASDLLARWGGEEFAVFFPETNLREAYVALNKALRAFRAERFKTKGGHALHVSFSAGIAQVKAGSTVEEAIGMADRFMYLAKASGRDRVLMETAKISSLKRNVLLVEDDDLTAGILKTHLKKDGFKVIHARTGAEALAAATRTPISLITLDVKIPGIDGFELLRRFREIPSIHQIPIVMLTSSGKQEEIVRGFQLGADDYILKPFLPREFLARVHRFLQKQ